MKKYKVFLLIIVLLLLNEVLLFSQEIVKPKPGEGVNGFLIRNNRPPKVYYKEFIELNKKKLGKNNNLVLGVNYTLPALKEKPKTTTSNKKNSSPSTINEPLFGKNQSKVDVKSNSLSNACFYIISGHGGPDPGAIGKIGNQELHEDEYAYDIALRLARNLMEEGAKVHIIIQDAVDGIRDGKYLANSKRETCMGETIPLNQKERLQQRSDKINSLYKKDKGKYKYCRAIFIHIDSRSRKKQTDVFFYHCTKKKESEKLAKTMKDTFQKKYRQHQPNRRFSGTVNGRGLYVLNNSAPASVYVELGNIQNSFDQQRIILNSNRQALANWLAEGFKEDYHNNK